jgi:hypothetical protein
VIAFNFQTDPIGLELLFDAPTEPPPEPRPVTPKYDAGATPVPHATPMDPPDVVAPQDAGGEADQDNGKLKFPSGIDGG